MEILKRQGAVSLKELEKVFTDVSSMTLRRDLEYFESTGEAVRVKGGIRYIKSLPGMAQEALYAQRLLLNSSAKDVISRIAAEYLEVRRSLYFDSGTTLMALARQMPDKHYSVLTNDPNIALEILKRYSPAVNLIGGLVNRETLSVSGMQSIEFVQNLNIELAFMASSAFSADAGFTCGNYSECELKKQILQKAKKKIMLIDSSKFGRTMPFTFAFSREVDVIITDTEPPQTILDALNAEGVTVRWN